MCACVCIGGLEVGMSDRAPDCTPSENQEDYCSRILICHSKLEKYTTEVSMIVVIP